MCDSPTDSGERRAPMITRRSAAPSPAPVAGTFSGARVRRTRRKLGRCHARFDLRRFGQFCRAERGRRAEHVAFGSHACSTACARERDPGACSLTRRSLGPGPLRSRSPALDRVPFARFLRHARRSAAVSRQSPAHLAFARAQPARDASDHGSVRLLAATLPEHPPRIDAPLPAPPMAGGRPHGHAARAQAAAT